MKGFIKKHWWKPLLAIWIIYAILRLASENFQTSLLFLVFWMIVSFAVGYDFGKKNNL